MVFIGFSKMSRMCIDPSPSTKMVSYGPRETQSFWHYGYDLEEEGGVGSSQRHRVTGWGEGEWARGLSLL